MVLFKDIHKKCEDLLNKDWAHLNSWEAENIWKSGEFTFKNKANVSGGFSIHGFEGSEGAAALHGKDASKSWAGPAVMTTEILHDTPSSLLTLKFDFI